MMNQHQHPNIPHTSLLCAGALRWAALLLIVACASPGTPPRDDLTSTRFAESLQLNVPLMTRLPSGLRYEDVIIGTGAVAERGQLVSVRYAGWLVDGAKIDSSPGLEFRLGSGQVIRGWNEGITGMRVGGTRTLVIPPALGYGYQDRGPIPGSSVLVFRVELLRVR
jgi:FKBP-type peptidyl-prolyl cis-trans isomerase